MTSVKYKLKLQKQFSIEHPDYERQHIDVQERDWKSYHLRFLEHARMYIACYEYRNLAVCVKTLFSFLEIIHGYWNINGANASAGLCSADFS